MTTPKRSEYKKAPNVLTLIGLCISVVMNIVLLYQYHLVNQRADRDLAMARSKDAVSREFARDKQKWVGQLKSELKDVEVKYSADSIDLIQENLKKTENGPFSNHEDVEDKIEKDLDDKEEMDKQRAYLIDQITYYEAHSNSN